MFALAGHSIPSRVRLRGRPRLQDARLQALGKVIESHLFTTKNDKELETIGVFTSQATCTCKNARNDSSWTPMTR